MEIKINEPWITGKIRCQGGYVYIDKPFWNTEKQQADHKREYIGKYDGKNFTPNKTFYRLKTEYEQRHEHINAGGKSRTSCSSQLGSARQKNPS